MKTYAALFLLFAVTACSDSDEPTKKSEPGGHFASGGTLAPKDAQSFSSCSVEPLVQQLPLNCKVISGTVDSQTDSVETGTYTFTLNNEAVSSVRFTRTLRASVACLENKNLIQKDLVTQITSVIYVHNSKASGFKSCDNTTPVWIKNKLELNSNEVIEEIQTQLVYSF